MLFCVGIVSGNEIDTHEHAHTQDGPEKHSLENTFSHTERAKVDEILMMCGCFCTNRKKTPNKKAQAHKQQAGRTLIFRRLSAVMDYTENGFHQLMSINKCSRRLFPAGRS